jgi:uncharacterized protein YjbI with pentapeptide repeats
MADRNQLCRLAHGVEEWNAWRKEEPRTKIDLAHAVLHESPSPFLKSAPILHELRDINLSHADLTFSVIQGADLRYADLSGADLRGANLRRSNLNGANLSGATLAQANLTLASLRDVDFNNTLF